MLNVLIACEYNSGRSQIACTYLNEYGSAYFTAECGGLDPKPINPLVALAMREAGFDIHGINSAHPVHELIKLKRKYDIVISVCSKESDKLFPPFPNNCLRINWPHDNPAQITGGRLDRLQAIRNMRDSIKDNVLAFIHDYEQKGMALFSGIPAPDSQAHLSDGK